MKILVLDDHVLIREALRGVIKELRDDAFVVEASDCRHAVSLIAVHSDLSLILLDLNLPDRDGFQFLAELRERYPAISVVVLSAFNDRTNVIRALDLGALGFIPKSASREVMLNALRLIFSGEMYIPPDILGRAQTSPAQPVSSQRIPDAQRSSPSDLGLTDRQLDVLALVMQGKSNKAICRILKLAEPTVKNHVTAILKALKVTNRTEAVIAVGEMGWDLRRPADSSIR
jgi:DNA-binding NarL/FixJ family response regulator